MKMRARLWLICVGFWIANLPAQPASDAIPQPGEEGFNYPMNTLLPCEPENEGWKLLHHTGSREAFDRNFTQWISGRDSNTALPSSWTYRQEDSSIYAPGATADIRSEFQVRDFDFRLNYRNSGNDGIIYKMLTRGSFAWSVGVEYAIDNNANTTRNTSAGAVFGLIPPEPPAQEIYRTYASGRWNFVRIVQKGDSVEHWLNNIRVLGYRFWGEWWQHYLNRSTWWGSSDYAQNTTDCKCQVIDGYLGFQGDHDGTWHLRNLRYNANQEFIRLGPVHLNGCGTGIAEKGPNRWPHSLERIPDGWRIRLPEVASSARIFGLNGKNAGRVEITEGGRVLVIRGTKPGLHYLRAQDAKGKELTGARIAIP